MNKALVFGIAIILTACTTQGTAPTRTFKLKPEHCAPITQSPSLGIVSINYQHPNNKVQLPGVDHGAVVVQLLENSPAHKNHLPIGSVIKSANGIAVTGPEILSSIIKAKKTGTIDIEYATDSGINHIKLDLKKVGDFTKNCTLRYITEN
jgi:S1-C subfamily serine protease